MSKGTEGRKQKEVLQFSQVINDGRYLDRPAIVGSIVCMSLRFLVVGEKYKIKDYGHENYDENYLYKIGPEA